VQRVRVFIDYWNFQLSWNRWDKAAGGPAKPASQRQCDWLALPARLIDATSKQIASGGVVNGLQLQGTTVYASIDPDGDVRLRRWLSDRIARQAGFDVRLRDRKARRKDIHCKLCRTTTTHCPNCGEAYIGSPEKGVDAAIVTDLLSLAWQGAYETAILVSGDADFIPAVEHVQSKGLKVVNASWRNRGHNLQRTCWASFHMDDIAEELCR